MKVSTVADLLAADDGDQPKAAKLKLSAVWKRRAGESNGNAYSFEEVEFMDATGKIKGTLAGREPIDKALIGKMLYIEAVKGEKGWSGLYIKDEKWTPKDSDEERTIRKLRVTKTAIISTPDKEESDNDGGGVEEDDIPYGGDDEVEKEKSSPKQPPKPTNAKPSGKSPTADAKIYLGKAANAMLLCLDAAEYVGKTFTEKSSALSMTPEQFQAITSTFFIAMDKRGFIEQMPVKPMEDAK